jgi:hypothetical protein
LSRMAWSMVLLVWAFCSLGWQALTMAPRYWLIWVGGVSWNFCMGWTQTVVLPISASQVAGITGVSHLLMRIPFLKSFLLPSPHFLQKFQWSDISFQPCPPFPWPFMHCMSHCLQLSLICSFLTFILSHSIFHFYESI